MTKEEILEKSKKSGVDERERMVELNSINWGLATVLTLVVFFHIWNLIHGEASYDLSVILAAYITATSFYKYKKLEGKSYLIAGIAGTIGTIAAVLAFFLGA